MPCRDRRLLTAAVLLGLGALAGSAPAVADTARASMTPAGVVVTYLREWLQGNCAQVGQWWDHDFADDCLGVTGGSLGRVKEYPRPDGARAAVVMAEYSLRRGAKETRDAPCFQLVRQDRGWVITGTRTCDPLLDTGEPAPRQRATGPGFLASEQAGAAPEVVVTRGLSAGAAPGRETAGPRPEPMRPPDAAAATAAEPSPDPSGSPGNGAVCLGPDQSSGPSQGIRKPIRPERGDPPAAALAAQAAAAGMRPAVVGGAVRSVEPGAPGARLVALTFDLCEQANERAGYQADLVDYLRRNHVKATFFAGGQWMQSHPRQTMQLMAEQFMAEPLFELGNHAWTHGNLRVLRGEEMRNQILWTQAQYGIIRNQLAHEPCAAGLMSRIPLYPRLFRFPYGTCNAESLAALADLGLTAIQWSVVTGDPDRRQSAAAIAERIITGVKHQPGAIVIGHANGRGWHTKDALAIAVPALRERGYEFVTVSELLGRGQPFAPAACYEVRPGDNKRYDALFGRGTGD